jgi:CheY-like chemotaxis protein
VDMGLEAYKIAAALRGVVAQRLMRRLCVVCREPATEPVPERATRFFPQGVKLFRAVGCPECTMTGYRGRFSIVEVLAMNPELERLIGKGATAEEIATAARASGMLSLWESGLRHVLAGESSVDELLRVTDVPQERAAPSAPARPAGRGSRNAPPAPSPVVAPPPSAPSFDFPTGLELIDEDLPETPAGLSRDTCVLLVEDEEQLRRVMKDLLEREGYTVAEARDGVQALDQADRHAPDIIVLDLNLPGVDGYTVLQQLRSRSATRTIPIVVLTAKGDEDNEVRVFQLGADDFITKPFRARALSARLEAVLGRHRV